MIMQEKICLHIVLHVLCHNRCFSSDKNDSYSSVSLVLFQVLTLVSMQLLFSIILHAFVLVFVDHTDILHL